jgi:hypothetical protein
LNPSPHPEPLLATAEPVVLIHCLKLRLPESICVSILRYLPTVTVEHHFVFILAEHSELRAVHLKQLMRRKIKKEPDEAIDFTQS